MDIQEFFGKLNRAVHWFLPYGEANDVMAEYQDMQQQAKQNGGQLFQPDENPWRIARELQNPREYRKWLLIFALLLLCPLWHLLFFTCGIIFSMPRVNMTLCKLFFWFSLALALFWAHRCKRQNAAPQRSVKIFAGAAACLIFGIAVLCPAVYWYYALCAGQAPWLTGYFLTNYLTFCAIIYILFAIYSLAKCRLANYRWLALYVISITLLLGVMLYIELLFSLSLEGSPLLEGLDQLYSYLLPLACALAASVKILW